MKQFESIKIYGTIAGNIWMPNEVFSKDFKKVFTPTNTPFTEAWEGLREAVTSITNDGDFRACGIVEAYTAVSFIDGNKRITITKELPNCKLISDCFADQSIIDQIYNPEFD